MKIDQRLAAGVFAVTLPLSLAGQQPARLDTTVRLNMRGTVDLSIVSGKITVRGWDQPDVHVQASAQNGILRFSATASRVTLRLDPERAGAKSRADATYDVSVPRGTRLRLQAASGSVTASGSQADVSATTVSGPIDVTGGRRQVSLESVSGSVRASQVAGDLRVQNVSGSVRAENVSGRIEAWTVRGGIRLIGGRANDVRAETASGDIEYSGQIATGAAYDFESHSGTIRLTVPRSAGAQFSLETVSGTVQSDFPVDPAPAGGGRKGGRVEFTIGDGRANVSARTFNGGILIKSDASAVRDPVAVMRSEPGSTARKDSAFTSRKDSLATPRRDSLPTVRND